MTQSYLGLGHHYGPTWWGIHSQVISLYLRVLVMLKLLHLSFSPICLPHTHLTHFVSCCKLATRLVDPWVILWQAGDYGCLCCVKVWSGQVCWGHIGL